MVYFDHRIHFQFDQKGLESYHICKTEDMNLYVIFILYIYIL